MKNIIKATAISSVFLIASCNEPSTEEKEKIILDCQEINCLPKACSIADISENEEYSSISENSYKSPIHDPLSTFSIDVDRASYSIVRKYINENRLPEQNAVRIEEMINYFDYNYAAPKDGKPFSITTELSECPWNKAHKLLLVGMKGKEIEKKEMAAGNFVFLIDVSGSMDAPDKLPLLQDAFKLFVNELRPKDKVSIVVYAGAAGAVLEGASGKEKDEINEAIENLNAGGSTAGAEGIVKAYELAEKNFIKGGNNRVILATDGDFNVGVSSEAELVKLIESKRNNGIYLSVLGFGDGNYKDNKMEQLADNGNGNYSYIDNILEAKKVLVTEIGGTIETIAKDVKLQLEFNPALVKAYRLIGYENRVLATSDFNNDKKDAGELGSGHCVTALYEIVPAGSKEKIISIDTLVFQSKTTSANTSEIASLKLRYKGPAKEDTASILNTIPVSGIVTTPAGISDNFKLASAVAEFGLLLRNSEFKGASNYERVFETLQLLKMYDKAGYIEELQAMVLSVRKLRETVTAGE